MAATLAGSISISSWAQDSAQSSPPAAPQTPQQASQPQNFVLQDYSKPASHFPNPISPYMPRHVSPPNLSNTPRIDELMHDGKLMLSMDDAVALALENNLDIAIARYNLNIADTDVLRAKAGAQILGVNAGIVQGTPGGAGGGLGTTSVGSGTGGTSAGTGGAGAGLNGLVGSTLGQGPQITSFDPILSSTLQIDHSKFVCNSPFCGTVQNTGTANFAYQQGFQSGTNLLV